MNIYQAIWKADENKFSVSRKNRNGTYEDPKADVLLDEQVRADGRRKTDLAKFPLFSSINQDKLNREPNSIFIKLLNNFVVNYRETEVYTMEELDEIYSYLESIQTTKVWTMAIDYIESELNESIKDNFKDILFDIWFKFYTNWYNGRPTEYCTGFEHVFVGEGKYNARSNGDQTLGEISGYHNWIKFLLDEKTGRVNFLGYNYGLNNNQGPDNPNVVTLQMTWEHRDLNGDLIAQLFKPKGGFFVGTSPECELAMGTIAYFENKKGMFSSNDKKQINIGSGRFNIVLYRNVNRDSSKGEHIRSFYPEYLGSLEFTEEMVRTVTKEPFKITNLFRLNNELYPDYVYKSEKSVVSKNIYSSINNWEVSFKNWKK